jgi:hypothetical protein
MPLSSAGSTILTNMIQEYGGSKKGKAVFYAKANKSKKFKKLIGRSGKKA